MSSISEMANKMGMQTQSQMSEKEAKSWRTVEINGDTYQYKLLGRRGIKVALKLKGVALPILGKAFDGMKQDDIYEAPQTFTDMALILNEMMDKYDVESLVMDDILYDVRFNGEKIDWDDHLMGDYSCLIPLIADALKENFGSTFTGGGMMKSIQDRVASILGSTTANLAE